MSQRRAVEAALDTESIGVWVAESDDVVAGFVAVALDQDQSIGEIHMLAVDAARQRRGIGAALTSFALRWISDSGMAVAMVETGADPGHAPARQVYERAGFTELPVSRYVKKL